MRPFSTLLLCLATAGLANAPLSAADAAALAGLTFSGDPSALEALDRDLVAAGRDPALLAPIETTLLAVLRRSDATFAARQAACQRLGRVLGQAGSAPAPAAAKLLAAMLLDERDSDLARLALEPVPGQWVDDLLLTALGKTTDRTRLGVIDSLARRRVAAAVPALSELLATQNPTLSTAVARALGAIGTPAADAALAAAQGLPAAVLGAARLEATTRRPATEALPVLRALAEDQQVPAHLRAAAFRRELDLDADGTLPRLAEVLAGRDWTMKQVALEALAGPLGPNRIQLLVSNLPGWDAPTLAGVIAALGRGGGVATVPAVLAAAEHAEAEVRTAAFTALGHLPGDGEVVALLARTAAGGTPDAKVARLSLARLGGAGVSAAILAGAESGDTPLRPVYLEQLALRNMTEALPLLRQCRQDTDAAVRAAAVAALGELAPFTDQTLVLEWTVAATDETEQSRALRALVNLTLRNRSVAERGRAIHTALLEADSATAVRLLPILARIGGRDSADCAATLALRDDPAVASEAVATLGRWPDAMALPALATVAQKGAVASARSGARDRALRYLQSNRERWTPGITAVVSRLLGTTTEAKTRREFAVLLARAGDSAAFELAVQLQNEPALADDARYAAAAIRANLIGAPRLRAAPGSGIANARDGKTSTRWSAPLLGEEWVEIDFRQSRPVRRLTLDQTGRGAEFPEHYEVYVTEDPATPGPAVVSGQGQRNRTVIELPPGTQGRYVVIRNTAERKDAPWSICELYID